MGCGADTVGRGPCPETWRPSAGRIPAGDDRWETPGRRGSSQRVRKAILAFSLVLVLSATGCTGSLAGRWRMIKCTPNRETFSIDHATFTSKGEYTANVSFEGRAEKEKGRFEFNGFNITFRPSAGGSRTFTAALRLKRLEIMDGQKNCVLEKQ